VIIQNTSKEDLRGVSVVFWERGVPPKHRQTYLTATLDPAHRVKKPGDYWLYFASTTLNYAAAGKNSVSMPPGISVSSILADLERNPLFVTIEWVMDAKGQMFGPDSFGTIAGLQAEQRARADLVKSLKGSADPKATLAAAAAIPLQITANLFDRDNYHEQLRRDARNLLDGLNAGNAGALQHYVAKVDREITITKP
jgi:hypothetical protein